MTNDSPIIDFPVEAKGEEQSMDKLLLKKCLRCNGAVTYEKFYGSQEQFWGWKCLLCGEIVDPVIIKNRQLMREGQMINFSSR